MTPERPGLYSPTRAGEYLDISRTRIYELIGSGELRSVKIGRVRRTPREALDDYIAQLQEQALAGTYGSHAC